ncbi:MAG: hypothetical protein KKG59_00320 [Nanoarchaeota archaeon]|nr:hypothetical protein [Nanoarchaeota archaeon]
MGIKNILNRRGVKKVNKGSYDSNEANTLNQNIATKYFIVRKTQDELDDLICDYFKLLSFKEDKVCKVCRTVQGKPKHGFQKYYCTHVTDSIERIQKKKKRKIANKVLSLVVPEDIRASV